MAATQLYQQLVLDHSRTPRRFGILADATHAAEGANPLCGDRLRVQVRVVDGRIVGFAFDGEACAIARASTSMLGDVVGGRCVAEVAQIAADIGHVVRGEPQAAGALGDLHALAALARHPSRQKCALLAGATLQAALAGTPYASTENHATRQPS